MVFQSYALFPHLTRGREHRLRPARAQGARAPSARAAARAWPSCSGLERAARAQALAALRRPAAARGARPRDHRRDAGVPDGRAALEPRRAAARARCAARSARCSSARHHHGLRDPRPDRGDDAWPTRWSCCATGASSRTRTPDELYARPATAFAARFIGTPPMNLLALADGRAAPCAGTDGPPCRGRREDCCSACARGRPDSRPAAWRRACEPSSTSAPTRSSTLRGRRPSRSPCARRGASSSPRAPWRLTWSPDAAHLVDASSGRARRAAAQPRGRRRQP